MKRLLLVLALAAAAFLPAVQANTITNAGVIASCSPPFSVANIGGLFNAGDINFCIYVPAVVHGSTGNDDTARITAVVTGPPGTTPTFTYATNVINGCTIGTITQADTLGNFGSMSSAHWNLDITDNANQCTGAVKVTVTAGLVPTTVFVAWIPWMIQTEPTEVDNINRLSGFGDWNTTVYEPSMFHTNCAATNGTPAAYTTATTCYPPYVKNSVAVTSWPGLTATVTMPSGLAITGSLEELVHLCSSGAIGSGCSTPTINVANSGSQTLTVHQDQACGASLGTRCYAEVSGINFNSTIGNVSFPATLNATLNGGSTPIVVGNPVGEFFLGILAWAVAFFVCLRFNKLLSAGACTLGIIASAFQLDLGWQAACIGVLGVTLWLEALGRDKIVVGFFQGDDDSSTVRRA